MIAEVVDILPWILCIAMAGAIVALWLRRRGTGPRTTIQTSVEAMRSVGELVVFKIVAKEIVTSSDHWLKDFGKRYLSWLVSEKKVALIFEFEIDFRYDLRSNAFRVETTSSGGALIHMPPCRYEVSLKGQRYYDEQESYLLPSILPRIISSAGGFSEEERNELLDEARQAAERLAQEYVRNLTSDVQKSARQTMEQMAHSLGIGEVTVDFLDDGFVAVETMKKEPQTSEQKK